MQKILPTQLKASSLSMKVVVVMQLFLLASVITYAPIMELLHPQHTIVVTILFVWLILKNYLMRQHQVHLTQIVNKVIPN